MDFSQTFFQIFGLEAKYQIDLDSLSNTYRELQKQYHPDRFASAPDDEKRKAVQWAAQINTAFNTLKTPLQRAIYLLKLADKEVEHNPNLDPMFLMEQIELRESLEEIEGQGEDALPALDKLKAEVKGVLKGLEADFAAQIDSDLAAAEQTVYKMQFMTKLLAEANQLEEQILDY